MTVSFVHGRIERDDVAKLAVCLACGDARAAFVPAKTARGADLRALWDVCPDVPCCGRCARLQTARASVVGAIATTLFPTGIGLFSVLAVPLDPTLQPLPFALAALASMTVIAVQRRREARRAPVVLLGGKGKSLQFQLRIAPPSERAPATGVPYRAGEPPPREPGPPLPVERAGVLPARLPDVRGLFLTAAILVGGIVTLAVAGQAYPVAIVGNAGETVLRYRNGDAMTHELSVGANESVRMRWGQRTIVVERGDERRQASIPCDWGKAYAIAVDDGQVCYGAMQDPRLREAQRKLGALLGLGEPGVSCVPLTTR